MAEKKKQPYPADEIMSLHEAYQFLAKKYIKEEPQENN